MKSHTDCIFYEEDMDRFGGCPGLDDGACNDGDCHGCPYRLERVIGIVRAAERHIKGNREVCDTLATYIKLKEAVGK